jgi:aspartyl protease family protein
MTVGQVSQHSRLGIGMTVAAWALLLLLLTWFASGFLQQQHNPNSKLADTVRPDGVAEVNLRRNRAGHYVASGRINSSPVVFLVDTGATDVAIDERLAKRIGLEKGFRVSIKTANGMTTGWRTVLNKVTLGAIELFGVPATIVPSLGEEALLGMSFLKQLTLIQKDDVLVMRQD